MPDLYCVHDKINSVAERKDEADLGRECSVIYGDGEAVCTPARMPKSYILSQTNQEEMVANFPAGQRDGRPTASNPKAPRNQGA